MAYPVILIDSGTGSDTAASGAGPDTALSGTSASYSGSVVTLDGSPDLSGVATDGSHVLWLQTSSGRQFFTINATDDGADTVTLDDAPAGTASGLTWGIGGKRASLFSNSDSVLLVINGGSNGDAYPGWAMEFQSGHTESFSSTIDTKRNSDTTGGQISIRTASGAATRPILTYTGSSKAFIGRGNGWYYHGFDIKVTGTATNIFDTASSFTTIESVHIYKSGAGSFTSGFGVASDDLGTYIDCAVDGATGCGFEVNASVVIENCYVANCGSHGIEIGNSLGATVVGCIVVGNTGDGINWAYSGGSNRSGRISNCTFDNNTGDGVKLTAAPSESLNNLPIMNNIFSNNGGYGLNFSDAGSTKPALEYYAYIMKYNNFYSNTTAATNPADIGDNNLTLDPQYVDTASKDYTVGANLKGVGYRSGQNIGSSTTKTYVDIGAAQTEAASGGGNYAFAFC